MPNFFFETSGLENSWLKYLQAEFEQPYMQQLHDFLSAEKAANKVIYPHVSQVYSAFEHTPLEQVKVVVLGQDPYHGVDKGGRGIAQAHGLSFSVQEGVRPPPSLVNIYKELHSDLAVPIPQTGYLAPWAKQGVLLLNSVLTVEAAQAGSHRKKGWEQFSDRVIHVINEQCKHVVFLLWGSSAQKKAAFVNREKHLVLQASHPSPLSAYRGFFGCKHFSQANAYLQTHSKAPIDWAL